MKHPKRKPPAKGGMDEERPLDAPTQKQMMDPSFNGNGKPNYIEKENESPVDKPHIDGADQGEPVYIATHKRYREHR